MSAVQQRKLVHKQFNSPMGLYSQENVKATLNRELKAFGAEGIEVDEQITKPLNLANSAVLRAVEEEEQQIKCVDYCPRQSRSRQRATPGAPHHAPHQQLLEQIKTHYLSHQQDVTIDRDTVLRINRLATRRNLYKRDHSWPPAEATDAHGERHTGTTLEHGTHFDMQLCRQHSIDALREKFNSPTHIVEPNARQVREQRQLQGGAALMKPSASSNKCSKLLEEQLATRAFSASPTAKGFSAPETKAADVDIGLVAPKCEYYEQLTMQRPVTPVITAAPSPTPTKYRPKRQAHSLDRGRARKRMLTSSAAAATELPPQKPRAGSAGNGKPQLQRRAIKVNTEIKISYDMGNDGDNEDDTAACQDISELEAMPLPQPPASKAKAAAAPATNVARLIDSATAAKQQQQLASGKPDSSTGTHIIAVTVEKASAAQPAVSLPSAQQIYDDACIYLRSVDQQDQTVAYIPAAITLVPSPSPTTEQRAPAAMTPPAPAEEAPATYVSATSGIKLQRQPSLTRQRSLPSSPSIPTPPPLPPPATPPLLRTKSTPAETALKQARRQGVYYSGGSSVEQSKQHETHVEIAQLEAKYAHIQQSIAEHLRQIDAYMENAKAALKRSVQSQQLQQQEKLPVPPAAAVRDNSNRSSSNNELWDMFAARQSPVLAIESPLQAILRQIYCKAAGSPLMTKSAPPLQPAAANVEENVPIVERALAELHSIALALDKLDTSIKPAAKTTDEPLVLHVEHKTTPYAAKAKHVIIEEEDVETAAEQDVATGECEAELQLSTDYKHVADVIANYEQLAGMPTDTATATATARQAAASESQVQDKQKLEQPQQKLQLDLGQQPAEEQQMLLENVANSGNYCAICGELRCSPHGWGKLTTADQWRFDNLQNEQLNSYKATYEIPSPYVSRQISWEDTQQAGQLSQAGQTEQTEQTGQLKRQRSMVEILPATTPATDSADKLSPLPSWQRSRSPSPLPARKYPAPLIDTAQRASSPFGLNAVQLQPTKVATTSSSGEATFSYVPQLEGHNIGLLVSTATQPLQLSMCASSSMLADANSTTPRCSSQPPPFEFMLQHGLDTRSATYCSNMDLCQQHEFKSLANIEQEQEQQQQGLQQHGTREFNINRSFDNVSPRPYIGIEGYKRVAWPPASEERVIREFTPQPQGQSPAPGAGGYYPQQPAAAPAQGPIYNNVQRSQPSNYQATQNVYGQKPTNGYAQNSNAATAAPAAAAAQYPANYANQQQQHQPIQYTQAQYNRQQTRDEPQEQYQPTQQQQQQQQYQQHGQHAVDNVGAGWKPIRAPLPKTHSDFHAAGSTAAPAYPPYQQQQQQQQPQQQSYPYQQQSQPQYRATSYDNYQQQQQPQPTAAYQSQTPAQPWQQQQQQPAAPWTQAQQQQQQPSAPHWAQQQQPSYQTSPYQQQQQQHQPHYPQQTGGANYAQPQYNSYSQPQQQQQQQQQPLAYSHDQTDLQQPYASQDSYRGASPGIITLRKEAPVSQQPAPVYTSQPAAVSYQGGSKLRGDLKWPPPEYKEAAARENEERRQLALGPVCRPRRVNRDYTGFFAKHQLNSAYPSYKVPPGTQHMLA